MAHVMDNWLEPDSNWIAGVFYLIISPIGIPSFMFAAGLSFGFTWAQKSEKGLDFTLNSIYAFARTCILLGLAISFNILGVIIHQVGIENIWLWYILLTMAIARLLGPYFMKLKACYRIIIAIVIIFFTHFYLMWLLDIKDTSNIGNLLYFISFNSIETDSIFFFMPIFLIGTVFGERLVDFQNKKNIIQDLKNWILFALTLIVFGLILGWNQSTYLYGWDKVVIFLDSHPDWNVSSLPLFLCRNSYAWVLFGSGLVVLMMVFLFYFLDLKNQIKQNTQNTQNNQSKSILYQILFTYPQLFGKYSLTIYFVHYLGHLLPWNFSYHWIFLAFFIFAFLIGIVIYSIDRYSDGKFSVEYILIWGSNNNYNYLSQKVLEKRKKKTY
jgi:hypothetical protein